MQTESLNESKWKPETLGRRISIPEDKRPMVLGIGQISKLESSCELTRLDIMKFSKNGKSFHSIDTYLTAADNEKGYMPLLHYYVSVNDGENVYPAKANIFQVDVQHPGWRKFIDWIPELIKELELKK